MEEGSKGPFFGCIDLGEAFGLSHPPTNPRSLLRQATCARIQEPWVNARHKRRLNARGQRVRPSLLTVVLSMLAKAFPVVHSNCPVSNCEYTLHFLCKSPFLFPLSIFVSVCLSLSLSLTISRSSHDLRCPKCG